MNKLIEPISEITINIGKQIALFSPKLLISIVIFLIFCVVAWILKKIVLKLASKATDSDKVKVLRLAGSTLKIVIILVGLIIALGTLGINVTAMITGLGLTGFALGFALKDALSNILAGILILFYQPFRCGDRIKISGCEGVVKNINLRYTVLESGDEEFLIPNSTCFTNWIAVKKEDKKNLSSN